MKKTSADFAGYPLTIFVLDRRLPEEEIRFPHRIMDRDHRPHAQLRGSPGSSSSALASPEQSEFKRLAHLAGTRTRYFKAPAPFFALLRLFCLPLAAFDAFFHIPSQVQGAMKALMQGCKFTWKSAFSQLAWLEEDAFDYPVTPAGMLFGYRPREIDLLPTTMSSVVALYPCLQPLTLPHRIAACHSPMPIIAELAAGGESLRGSAAH